MQLRKIVTIAATAAIALLLGACGPLVRTAASEKITKADACDQFDPPTMALFNAMMATAPDAARPSRNPAAEVALRTETETFVRKMNDLADRTTDAQISADLRELAAAGAAFHDVKNILDTDTELNTFVESASKLRVHCDK